MLARNLSVRAGIYCVAAITAALIAVFFAPYVPERLAEILGGDAVDRILTILASSMLAVVTFSLSTLVSTYSLVASAAPPRATALIIDDKRAQSALSAFLGAFIFSIVSLVALSTKYYGPKGRVILFFITVAVLAAVVWVIIRWIGQLSGLGRLVSVVEKVESAAERAIERHRGYFAWHWPEPQVPTEEAVEILAEKTGFIQTIDFDELSILSEKSRAKIFVQASVGEFVHPELVLARFTHQPESKELTEKLRSCFLVGTARTFDEDPRFGLIALSEIGSRALSSGINDPGTAIHALSSLIRLVLLTREVPEKNRESSYSENLYIRRVTANDIFDDAFRPISRDGAGVVEVSIFLHKGLKALAAYPEFHDSALQLSQEALERSRLSQMSSDDLDRIEKIVEKIMSQ